MDDTRRPLVLALGDLLLEDAAVGQVMLDRLRHERPDLAAAAEFVDGGTEGPALLALLSGRPGVVVLDAIGSGAPPGTVHVLDGGQALGLTGGVAGMPRERGVAPLLAIARSTGDLPGWVRVVGVEPMQVRAGMGLSEAVRDAMPQALEAAMAAISSMLSYAGVAAGA